MSSKKLKLVLAILFITILSIMIPQVVYGTSVGDTTKASEGGMGRADNQYCLTAGDGFAQYGGIDREHSFVCTDTISVSVGHDGTPTISHTNSSGTSSITSQNQITLLTRMVAGQVRGVEVGTSVGKPGGKAVGYVGYNKYSDAAVYNWYAADQLGNAGIGFEKDSANNNAAHRNGYSINSIDAEYGSYIAGGGLNGVNAQISIYRVIDDSGNVQTIMDINYNRTTPPPSESTPSDTPTPEEPGEPPEGKHTEQKIEKEHDEVYKETEDEHEEDHEESGDDTPAEGTDTKGEVSISGTVWKEITSGKANEYNGKKDDDEGGIENIKVIWKTADGSEILAEGYTDKDGNYKLTTTLIFKNHSYEITEEQFNRISDSYVEFEYNGLKYTTTYYEQGGASADTSKAKEDVLSRNILDNKFDSVTPNTQNSVLINNIADDLNKNDSNYVVTYDDNGKLVINDEAAIKVDGEALRIEYDRFGNSYVNGKIAKITDNGGDSIYVSYGTVQFETTKTFQGLDVNDSNEVEIDAFGNYYVRGKLAKIEYEADGTAYALLAELDSNGNPIVNYSEPVEIKKETSSNFTVTASTQNIISKLIGNYDDPNYIFEPGTTEQQLWLKEQQPGHFSGYEYYNASVDDVCVWHCDQEHVFYHTKYGHSKDCYREITCYFTWTQYWHRLVKLYQRSCKPNSCTAWTWETTTWTDSKGNTYTRRYKEYAEGHPDVENECCGHTWGPWVLINQWYEDTRTTKRNDSHIIKVECLGDCCIDTNKRVTGWEITNVNLGLIEKEQPDLALSSDIDHVRVIMNNQEYTYEYNYRSQIDADASYDYQVVFQDKTLTAYRRPVNPADISYNYNIPDSEEKPLQVYVTYKISAKNFSNTLIADVNKIVNYYDSDYTLYKKEQEKYPGTTGWYTTSDEIVVNEFKAAYLDWNVELEPQSSATTYVEYQVNNDAIKSLLTKDSVPLNNVSEIFSYTTKYGSNTICAELEEAKRKNPDRTGSLYSGVDRDSVVGNVQRILSQIDPPDTYGNSESVNNYNFEDDEDCAPTFYLEKDEYKIISGTVYEDTPTSESINANERLGDGKNTNEKGVANVKVELLEVDEKTGKVKLDTSGNEIIAKLYSSKDGTATNESAVTYTDTNGNYSFGEDGRIGVVVDYYVIRYTYGNDIVAKDSEGNVILKNGATTINGNVINARNYKSTIIKDGTVSLAMQNQNNDKWHLTTTDDYSVAVDDLNERLSVQDLQNSNFSKPQNMVAYSMPFKTQVEYTESQENKSSQDGNKYILNGEHDFECNWKVFDFGIVERAREDLILDKAISYVRITLSNGQILIAGDPRNDKLDYVKTMGMKSAIKTRDEARKVAGTEALNKQLSIEIDSELIQGATLELQYAITLTNNSEKDYEYEYGYKNTSDSNSNISITTGNRLYNDIAEGKYITKCEEANYYYYGVKTDDTPLIVSTVDYVIDYLDPELTCTVGSEAESDNGDIQVNKDKFTNKAGAAQYVWQQVEPDYDEYGDVEKTATTWLKEKGLIGKILKDDVEEDVKDDLDANKSLIFLTNAFWDVEAGNSKTIFLYASKLLGSQGDDYVYDNHAEIVKIDGKIARTIDSVGKDREQIAKTYEPGNYSSATTGRVEQDDDMVRVVITPPTGSNSNIITYVIVGAISLIVIAGGIYFIKKKVIK